MQMYASCVCTSAGYSEELIYILLLPILLAMKVRLETWETLSQLHYRDCGTETVKKFSNSVVLNKVLVSFLFFSRDESSLFKLMHIWGGISSQQRPWQVFLFVCLFLQSQDSLLHNISWSFTYWDAHVWGIRELTSTLLIATYAVCA